MTDATKIALLFIALIVVCVGVFYVRHQPIRDIPTELIPANEITGPLRSDPIDFAQTGVIAVDTSGGAQGTLSLVYEENGAEVSKELMLDMLSVCATETGAVPCMAMSVTFDAAFGGKSASIEGENDGDKVLVRKLRVTETDRPVAPSGDVFIPWPRAVQLIKACEVDAAMQTHALDVYLTLKNGEKVRAVEPTIDEMFRIVQEANHCPGITVATE